MAGVNPDIQPLLKHNERLLAFAEDVLKGSLPCKSDDHLGFMAITFTVKQVEHLRSIMILIANGQFADTAPLARVMLEGMAVLLWAAKSPDERPYKWRSHVIVHDLHTLRIITDAGEPVPSSVEETLAAMAKEHAVQFLKRGTPSPTLDAEDYRSRWHVDESGKVITMDQMFGELRAPMLYDVYRSLSDWIHWNAAGIAPALTQNGDRISVDFGSPDPARVALAVAFQALAQTMQVLDTHLSLGRNRELSTIIDGYVSELRAIQT